MTHLFLYHETAFTATHEDTTMAAKRVASALHVLMSDGHISCNAWSDNIVCEAFIANYFTARSDDSSKESDNDDTGNILQCRASTTLDLQTHCNS